AFVDRGILDRREGEDQRGRILLVGLVGGGVGDEVAVHVAVARVEVAGPGAGGLRGHQAGQRQGDGERAQEAKGAKTGTRGDWRTGKDGGERTWLAGHASSS